MTAVLHKARKGAQQASAALAALLLAACATGQPEGAPVRLGSTVAEAQKALGTAVVPVRDPAPPGELTLALDAQGVQLFFDKTDRVRTVRLRAPYAAPVMGVRIGDPVERVLSVQGKPSAKATAAGQTGYTYHPDQITILTYFVGKDERVEAIFLVR